MARALWAFEGRIGAVIRTESDVALEADCAQFITLQERYLFHAGTQGYWLEDEQRYVELEVKPNRQFLDKQGRSVCGEVLFSESDLKALFDPEIDVFGAEQWLRPAEGEERDLAGNHAGPELEAPDKTPFPGSRMPELVDFLTNFHRKQTVSGGSCSGDAAALEAARSHFSKYVITRKMVRDARRTAGCLGRPGKRLNHAEK